VPTAPAIIPPVAVVEQGVEAVPALTEVANGDEPHIGFDESAESAFLADAKSRGEVVSAPRRAPERENETEDEKEKLPALDEMVKRIPPDVREALEDLFRAKFIAVRRVPKDALK
jgi:hypothetical protein